MNNQTTQSQIPPRSRDKAIESANNCAFLRAMATLEKDENLRNPDYLARYFINATFRQVLETMPVESLKQLVESKFPTSYHHLIARTKHVDIILNRVIKEGVKQVVILGAGYDSRAYRFQKQLEGIRIYELDFPGTQAQKKAKLAEIFGEIPTHVTYVPIDFNSQTIKEELPAAGYDRNLKTLFIWEGVLVYLTEDAVNETLQFISENALPGSSIILDYAHKSFIDGTYKPRGGPEASSYAKTQGEPYIFGIEESAIEEFMDERGFEVISHLYPGDLERAYLKRRDGIIDGKVHQYINMAHALIRGLKE